MSDGGEGSAPNEYGYTIVVSKIRPFGGRTFEAKVGRLVRYDRAKNPPGVDVRPRPALHIFFGFTREEASEKAIAEVEEWIKNQGGVTVWTA